MFERLEPVNIWLISVINDTNDHFLVKIVVDILRPASAICDILCRIQTTELDQAYMINTMILAKRNQECGLVTQTSFLLLRPPTAAPTRLRQKEPRWQEVTAAPRSLCPSSGIHPTSCWETTASPSRDTTSTADGALTVKFTTLRKDDGV